jgi:DNA-binding MarR family transcriptional regulator
MRNEEAEIIHAFKRLIHVLTAGKRTPREYGGVTLYRAEVHILEIIGKRSGITASDIVNAMDVTKGAISQIISKLSAKGLLQKSSRAENMRIQELCLTEKGAEVLLHHNEREKELMEKVMPEIEKYRTEDLARFVTIVNSVIDFVKK